MAHKERYYDEDETTDERGREDAEKYTKGERDYYDDKKRVFGSFMKALKGGDEATAMAHLEGFLEFGRKDDDEDDDYATDPKREKAKKKLMDWDDGAYEDDDTDYLADRIQQNRQSISRKG